MQTLGKISVDTNVCATGALMDADGRKVQFGPNGGRDMWGLTYMTPHLRESPGDYSEITNATVCTAYPML